MPYYVHYRNCEPSADEANAYDTKPDAVAARTGDKVITFVASEDERAAWRTRETDRSYANDYMAAPFLSVLERYRYSYDDAARYAVYTRLREHFPHLSSKHRGKVAYTPDETFGHEDRQLVVTPARYLEQFYKAEFGLTADNIAQFVGAIAACSEGFKLETDGAAIARAYSTPNGPSSCMDGEPDHCPDPAKNPTRVYGGSSDLCLAYMGIIGPDLSSTTISARAIVWPEKKTYYRVYGAVQALTCALQADGYKHAAPYGAKIRAVNGSRGYVMPYVDGVEFAELVGKHFVLTDDDGSDCYHAQVTGGYTSETDCEPEEPHYCAHCERECDEDETYCSRCYDAQWSCEACDESYFDEDERNETANATLCNHCHSHHNHTCGVCDDEYNAYDYGYSERQALTRSREISDMCPDCRESGAFKCLDCGEAIAADDMSHTVDVCKDCAHCRNRIAARPRGVTLRTFAVGLTDARPLLEQPFLSLDVPTDLPRVRELPVQTIGEYMAAAGSVIRGMLQGSGIATLEPPAVNPWDESNPQPAPVWVGEALYFGSYGSDEYAAAIGKVYPACTVGNPCAELDTDGHSCTRAVGHSGPHVAHMSSGRVVAAWPKPEPDPTPDPTPEDTSAPHDLDVSVYTRLSSSRGFGGYSDTSSAMREYASAFPMSPDGRYCDNPSPCDGFICTRPAGHDGQHVGHYDPDVACAAWPRSQRTPARPASRRGYRPSYTVPYQVHVATSETMPVPYW